MTKGDRKLVKVGVKGIIRGRGDVDEARMCLRSCARLSDARTATQCFGGGGM